MQPRRRRIVHATCKSNVFLGLIPTPGDKLDLKAFGDLELPRIAVIGNQSAGKSSLIEAISGITVPRASGTCTRCPMECRLKQSDSRWQCQVLLRTEVDAPGVRRQKTEKIFGPIVYDTDELEKMLRRAQLAILNPSVPSNAFVDFDLTSLEEDVLPLGSHEQLGFSSNTVCLDVSGPDVPDLSFIDLPGNDIEAVKNMVMTHIQGRGCLILLTISAAFLAKTVDPNGERTIGVLTKPDTLQAGEEKIWKEILEGRRHRLAHGYYITKQPSPMELQANVQHKEARRIESDFFKHHETWSRCDSSTKSRMGTAKLGQSLSKLLSERIDTSLPELRAQVAKQRKATENELASLPARLVHSPSMEIITLLSNYLGEFSRYDLIRDCTPAYRSFAGSILRTAPNIVARERERHQPSTLIQESEELEYERSPLSPVLNGDTDSETTSGEQEPMYLDELRSRINQYALCIMPVSVMIIRTSVRRSITRELPHNVPFSAKVTAILGCFVRWEALSLEALDSVYAVTQDIALGLIEKHFLRFSYSSLDEKVKTIVLEELKHCKKDVSDVLIWMVDLENPPYTQNEHYFSSCRDRYLTEYKQQRSVSTSDELAKLDKPDPYEREMIVAAEVRAYFRVAYKRIIDNIPRAIDRNFIGKLVDRIQTVLYSQLQIGTEEGLELAANLMAEDPSVALRREDLEAKSARLTDISAKLFRSL
ncbi:hypothetical protein BS47DRAFT_1371660 [Hydnum rufescens UP504]|uniref:Uncharacterized protein n=1 Tax=Hydnum rufescens UP504 TaxID=1448309 RepID=A0A9P6DWR6_9AGAM|nr:hypothetical protein BS47DRAFT_1371660 [Hydnum rufescens UP504]